MTVTRYDSEGEETKQQSVGEEGGGVWKSNSQNGSSLEDRPVKGNGGQRASEGRRETSR